MHPYLYQALIADRQATLMAEAERERVAKRARMSRRLWHRRTESRVGPVTQLEPAPGTDPVPIALPLQRSVEDIDAAAGADAGMSSGDRARDEMLAARKIA
jgi:hypothetical protein